MANKVEIFAKNLKVTERIEEYANKKITKLYRYLNDIEETRVDLSYAKAARNAADRQVAQITIRGRGYILRTEERADDIFAAIDEAVEKMQRQISRAVASMPSIPGMDKSIKTTSGANSSARRTASAPDPASPQTTKSG